VRPGQKTGSKETACDDDVSKIGDVRSKAHFEMLRPRLRWALSGLVADGAPCISRCGRVLPFSVRIASEEVPSPLRLTVSGPALRAASARLLPELSSHFRSSAPRSGLGSRDEGRRWLRDPDQSRGSGNVGNEGSPAYAQTPGSPFPDAKRRPLSVASLRRNHRITDFPRRTDGSQI
jgi:hypothetical protein